MLRMIVIISLDHHRQSGPFSPPLLPWFVCDVGQIHRDKYIVCIGNQEEDDGRKLHRTKKNGLGRRKACQVELQIRMIKLLPEAIAPHYHQDVQKSCLLQNFLLKDNTLNLDIAIWTRDRPAGEGGCLVRDAELYTLCMGILNGWHNVYLDMSRLEPDSERKEERLCRQGESSTERLGYPEGLLLFWGDDGTWQRQRRWSPTTGAGSFISACFMSCLKKNEWNHIQSIMCDICK